MHVTQSHNQISLIRFDRQGGYSKPYPQEWWKRHWSAPVQKKILAKQNQILFGDRHHVGADENGVYPQMTILYWEKYDTTDNCVSGCSLFQQKTPCFVCFDFPSRVSQPGPVLEAIRRPAAASLVQRNVSQKSMNVPSGLTGCMWTRAKNIRRELHSFRPDPEIGAKLDPNKKL